MLSSACSLFALAAFTIPFVSAHGFVSGVVANGQSYPGTDPVWFYSPEKPPRAGWYSLNQDTGYVGIADFNDFNMSCHKNGISGTEAITVAAGSSIDLEWTVWPESHHGPVITSLARCRSNCSASTPDQLKFFTIDQKGLISGSPAPGRWASDELIANNNTWTVTIPSGISGNFVLRHDIIALHSAQDQTGANGAQAYPNCINLQVTGSGQQHPCKEGADCRFGSELYGVSDPGILVNIYYPALTNYTIPGPQIWSGLGVSGAVSTDA